MYIECLSESSSYYLRWDDSHCVCVCGGGGVIELLGENDIPLVCQMPSISLNPKINSLHIFLQ